METPALGLAYGKTAALADWSEVGSRIRGMLPDTDAIGGGIQKMLLSFMGGTKPAKPIQQQPKPAAPQPQAPKGSVKGRTPDQRRAATRAAEPALRKNRAYMDAIIHGDKMRRLNQQDPNAPRKGVAAEQARREADGDWAWRSAQRLGAQSGHGTRPGVPNFPGRSDMAFNIGADRSSAEAGGGRMQIPRSPVAGMSGTDFANTVNKFMDDKALEGQGARGMGLDEFQRYMGRNYPAQAAASRAKYDKPEIAWGENDPMYQTPSKTPGKAPIGWQPTTYEQAARMGVLEKGGLKAPGSTVPRPQMRSYGGGVSADLTPAQQANLDANGGWKPTPKPQRPQPAPAAPPATPRGLGANPNNAGSSALKPGNMDLRLK